jgi:hypothetical protein
MEKWKIPISQLQDWDFRCDFRLMRLQSVDSERRLLERAAMPEETKEEGDHSGTLVSLPNKVLTPRVSLSPVSKGQSSSRSRRAAMPEETKEGEHSGTFVSLPYKVLTPRVSLSPVSKGQSSSRSRISGTFVSLSTPLTRSSRVPLPSRKVSSSRLETRAKSANRGTESDNRRQMVRLSACRIKSLLLICSRLFSCIERAITYGGCQVSQTLAGKKRF